MRPPTCLCRLKHANLTTPIPYISSGAKRRFLSSEPGRVDDVSAQLREVMRNVPQPVAIVTARNTSPASTSAYHGATLTSFTSLTLHPHPLVAFSLRLPSRLADCLRQPLPSSSLAVTAPSPTIPQPKSGPARIPLTVSLLSRLNRPIADALSSRLPDQSPIFARMEWADSDTGNPPALREAIGALRCEVVSSIPLRDMCGEEESVAVGQEGVTHQLEGSELFICRVLEVVPGMGAEPLLHLKQSYVGVRYQEEDTADDSEGEML